MKNLAENLVLLRKNNNFTQDDIAEKMYVSRQAVSKWERGESIPDIETIKALSDLYGITIDDLIKVELSQTDLMTASTNKNQNYDELKRLHRQQTIKQMILWAFLLLGSYSLLCGLIQVAFANVESIFIFWFTLPVVPPIIFAIRFRHEIGKKFIMFFIDVPFIAGMIFLILEYSTATDGAWLIFLLIPFYYIVAITVCVQQIKYERNAKANKNT